MAKYTELSQENKDLFEKVLDGTSIPSWVIFKTLANNKQKEIYKINKANDVVEIITDGINFIIILNEEIFDELTEEQKTCIIDECLAGVVYDGEKDTISLNKPDFTTYSGILTKYGHDDIITLNESIKSLYDAKKQQEDEEKAARKAKRNKKKSFV